MQLFRSLFLLGSFAAACALLPCADAQDAAPTPATDANPTAAEAADLFPSGGAQATPAPGTGGRAGGGHRNSGGGHGRNNRRHDLLVSQADADPLQLRVAFRRAETIAMARDPDLAVLVRQAAAADTDPEKRVYLKEYYTRLFDSVRKIDPSPEMKAHVRLLTLVAEQRYDPKRREVGGDEDLVNGRGSGRRGRAQ